MKANAPEKIYLLKSQNRMLDGWYNELPIPKTFEQVEYTRTDTFIEKACDAYCAICDTKECSGTGECIWVKNFRKRLMK